MGRCEKGSESIDEILSIFIGIEGGEKLWRRPARLVGPLVGPKTGNYSTSWTTHGSTKSVSINRKISHKTYWTQTSFKEPTYNMNKHIDPCRLCGTIRPRLIKRDSMISHLLNKWNSTYSEIRLCCDSLISFQSGHACLSISMFLRYHAKS